MCALDLPGAICSGYVAPPANDLCVDAEDISDLTGGATDVTNTSGVYTNEGALNGDEPATGWDCFGEPDGTASGPTLENSVWFSFEGDGNEYSLATSDCGTLTDSYITDGDTQMAVYSGADCSNLVEVEDACNEDADDGTTNNYYAGSIFQTTEGEMYYVLVDGFDATELGGAFSIGEFCLEVTNLTPISVEEFEVNAFTAFPNPTSDVLTLTANAPMSSYTVYDVLGKVVANEFAIQATTVIVDTDSFDSGIYLIDVEIDGQVYTQRIVKK